MIFAELHGKLSGSSRLHERREDVLTSSAFGLLRYVSDETGILALLRLVRRVTLVVDGVLVEDDPNWLPVSTWARCDAIFWPRYGEYGEPDLRIDMFDRDNRLAASILIEAKYLSPKSGEAEEDESYDPAIPDSDQLVRYWQALAELSSAPFKAIIYLTAHAAPPKDELHRSLKREPRAQLGWMSWRDVWTVVKTVPESSRPMADLAALLAHKGLKPFTGFSVTAIGELPTTRLFTGSGRWFSALSHLGRLPNGHFWRR